MTQQELASELTKLKIKRENILFKEKIINKVDNTPIIRATISKYENGKLGMNQDILYDLSNIFDVTVDKFFPYIKEEKEIYKDKDGFTISYSNINNQNFDNLSDDEKKHILDQAIFELSKLKLEIYNK